MAKPAYQSAVPQPAVAEQAPGQWQVGLCDCCAAGCCSFLYAWLCSPCSHASARSTMDDSNWCFNCLCIGLTPVARNIIREGYHIDGTCCWDIIYGLLCSPCSSCQLYAETEKRGRQNMVWGPARSPQEQPFKHGLFSCCEDCGNCLCGFICPGWAFARARADFDGSNCLFNCLCMSPCLLRSIVRDGYNLQGSCVGDICLPTLCLCCSATQLLNEVKERGSVNKVYVSGGNVMQR